MSELAQQNRRLAAQNLKNAALFGGAGVLLSAILALTGLGLPCPWRTLTHTLCPLCGSTTMGVAMLHGDFAAAWQANPFTLVLAIGYLAACVLWLSQLVGGFNIKIAASPRARQIGLSLVGFFGIAFMIVRNM